MTATTRIGVASVALAMQAAGAQVVRGVVRESGTATPIAGAGVVIRDSLRAVVGTARSGRDGTFTLRASGRTFTGLATRIGFAPESVQAPALDSTGATHLLFEMRAVAVTLNPVVIAEEKRQIRQTRIMGLDLRSISTDVITPTQIAISSLGAADYLDAIRKDLPAGASVNERTHCVAMLRGGLITGGQVCSMIFVDGMQVLNPDDVRLRVLPQWLDHAIFLRPNDATVRFGTGAAAGVLLLFTKHGPYALDKP